MNLTAGLLMASLLFSNVCSANPIDGIDEAGEEGRQEIAKACGQQGGQIISRNGMREIICFNGALIPAPGKRSKTSPIPPPVEERLLVDRKRSKLSPLPPPVEEKLFVEKPKKIEKTYSATPLLCDDELKALVQSFLKDGSRNIIGKQFHLTNLKLSRMVLKEKQKNRYITTLEELARAKNKEINKLDKSGKIRAKMIQFYRLSPDGQNKDQDFVDQYSEKLTKSKYWHPKYRMFNNHTSAFVLAHASTHNKEGNPKDLTELDAATLWLMDKVQKSAQAGRLGSAKSNMLNSSTQIAFMTGAVKNKRMNRSLEEIEREIAKHQSEINSALEDLTKAAKEKLSRCIDKDGVYKGNSCKIKMEAVVRESLIKDILEIANKAKMQDIKIDGKKIELESPSGAYFLEAR